MPLVKHNSNDLILDFSTDYIKNITLGWGIYFYTTTGVDMKEDYSSKNTSYTYIVEVPEKEWLNYWDHFHKQSPIVQEVLKKLLGHTFPFGIENGWYFYSSLAHNMGNLATDGFECYKKASLELYKNGINGIKIPINSENTVIDTYYCLFYPPSNFIRQ